jgi:hypothetical protein
VGMEWSPLSFVSTTEDEELLERKSSGPGLETRDYGRRGTAALTMRHPSLPESASKLYRQSDRRVSGKLVPTLADRGCHVISVTDPYGCILDFLDH